jgi:dTMP kinase
MKDRKNKFTGSTTKDIHESNTAYLTSSYYNALEVANKYQWAKISCTSENGLRSIDEIHEQIYTHVMTILDK